MNEKFGSIAKLQRTILGCQKFAVPSTESSTLFEMILKGFGMNFISQVMRYLGGAQRNVGSICKSMNSCLRQGLHKAIQSITTMCPLDRKIAKDDLTFIAAFEPLTQIKVSGEPALTVISFAFNTHSNFRELTEADMDTEVDQGSDLYWMIEQTGNLVLEHLGVLMRPFEKDFVAMQTTGVSIQ